MHILFLTDNFPPEVNAPASRTFEHCREWVAAGHRVTVITGAPNFPRGELFTGYRNRLWQEERMDGIRVIRVWTFISANEGFGLRVLDYLSYMVSAFVATLFLRRVDIVLGTSPQFFTACAAWAAAAIRRAPFVFELRDLWPASIRAVGALRNQRILAALERIELFLYRRAALVVCVTEAFRADLTARGIDPHRLTVVTNGVDLSRFRPMPRDEALAASLGLTGKFVAGYIGTHGLAHGLETLLDAAEILKQRGADDIRIVLLGDGARKPAIKAAAQQRGITSVIFLDTVPKSEVPHYWGLLDATIIHLRRDPVFCAVIPSKLFEAMAMGIPVILGVEGEAADILTRAKAGLPIPPEDAPALAEALLAMRDDARLLADLGENGRSAALAYSRPALAATMLTALESVAAGQRAPVRLPA